MGRKIWRTTSRLFALVRPFHRESTLNILRRITGRPDCPVLQIVLLLLGELDRLPVSALLRFGVLLLLGDKLVVGVVDDVVALVSSVVVHPVE